MKQKVASIIGEQIMCEWAELQSVEKKIHLDNHFDELI